MLSIYLGAPSRKARPCTPNLERTENRTAGPHITIYEIKDGKYLKTFYSLNLVAKAQEIGLPAYMDYDTDKEAIFLKIY